MVLFTVIVFCTFIILRFHGTTILLFCCCIVLSLENFVLSRFCSLAVLSELHISVALSFYSFTLLQFYSRIDRSAILQFYSCTIPRLYSFTVLRFHSLILLFHNFTVPQFHRCTYFFHISTILQLQSHFYSFIVLWVWNSTSLQFCRSTILQFLQLLQFSQFLQFLQFLQFSQFFQFYHFYRFIWIRRTRNRFLLPNSHPQDVHQPVHFYFSLNHPCAFANERCATRKIWYNREPRTHRKNRSHRWINLSGP